MIKKRYIYANLRIPVELNEDGSLLEIYHDRMTIEFEACRKLPEPTSYENQELIAKIFAIQNGVKDSEVIVEDSIVEEHGKDNSLEKEEEEEEEEDKGEEQEEVIRILNRDLLGRTNRTRHNISFRSIRKSNGGKQFTQRLYT